VEFSHSNKAIYGTDGRINVCDIHLMESGPKFLGKVRQQSQSIACLMYKDFLNQGADHYQLNPAIKTLSQRVLVTQGSPLDPSAPFRDEPVVGFGTGFLVGSDLVATAAHCVCKKDSDELQPLANLRTIRIIFNLQNPVDGNWKVTQINQIYKIKYVASHKDLQGGADWALLKLNREVVGIRPLQIDFSRYCQIDRKAYMLGHPQGLPLKFSGGGRTRKVDDPERIQVEITAFGGNSGSPVFDRISGKVIGILVRGQKDLDQQILPDGSQQTVLYVVSPLEIQALGFETCQRVSFLREPIFESRASAGFSLVGQCTLTDSKTIVYRGFGKFDVAEAISTAVCSCCGQAVMGVDLILLTCCTFRYESVKEGVLTQLNDQKSEGVLRIKLEGYSYFRTDVYALEG